MSVVIVVAPVFSVESTGVMPKPQNHRAEEGCYDDKQPDEREHLHFNQPFVVRSSLLGGSAGPYVEGLGRLGKAMAPVSDE